ncbi:two-component system, OmpR family, sensor histidine kinase PrrB [Thermomonospora echinospora]|uniref:histidine kinase n=1 Tax=Thermomonospora echinospora TaxID=1992 RepID=A0A1H6CCS8_9ACTN|nr:HAMP domain-containing sensor histidine kinase [Thermomonospora echinospora]SEG70791.1 two-component system, OmpR family, sensor histidine kinase PrrB [Thermomonospora echinospora]
MKLSTRFALCVAVLVPLLVLVSGTLVTWLAVRDLHAERDRRISAKLAALAPLATTYTQRARVLPPTPGSRAERRLSTAALGENGAGGVFVELPGEEPLVIGDVPVTLPVRGAASPADMSDRDGSRWRYAVTALGGAGRAGRLWVFEPQSQLDAQVARLRGRLLAGVLIAAAAGAAAGFGLGRYAVRPLSALARRAGALDRAPGRRLPTASRVTEIDELARLLNELLDRRDAAVARTAEALETARAFAATAAHELRTPLTSMGTNLGLLTHPELDEPGRREILDDLTAEHHRIQRLITMLRQLARGELLDAASFAAVDLTDLVDAAVEDAGRRHPHATIVHAPAEPTPVRAWVEGLRLVIDNLLDNAAVHGAAPSGRPTIEIALTRTPESAALTITDDGPGIPDALRPRIFDRFTRRPGSPGSGLGLTLVHQQVVLHGGTVTVTAPPTGTGTRITVTLPLAGSTTSQPTR